MIIGLGHSPVISRQVHGDGADLRSEEDRADQAAGQSPVQQLPWPGRAGLGLSCRPVLLCWGRGPWARLKWSSETMGGNVLGSPGEDEQGQ